MKFYPFFHFLENLKQNNSREWFKANKKTYQEAVNQPFEDLLEKVLCRMGKEDADFTELEVKNCVFRIHRDVRFSKNKDPYKLNRSALITPFGKKGMADKGFYFEMGLENIRFYAGLYQPSKEEINSIRHAICIHKNEFKQIYLETNFQAAFKEIRGEKNKRIPTEFIEDSKIEPLIFNKQWYIFKDFDRIELEDPDFVDKLIDTYRISLPFQTFLQTHRI